MEKQIPIDQQKGMFARCKKCKGYGYHIEVKQDYPWRPPGRIRNICKECNGTGRLDWVERITRQ